jgi:hypothetical protein
MNYWVLSWKLKYMISGKVMDSQVARRIQATFYTGLTINALTPVIGFLFSCYNCPLGVKVTNLLVPIEQLGSLIILGDALRRIWNVMKD